MQSALKAQANLSVSRLNKVANLTLGGDVKWSDKADFGAINYPFNEEFFLIFNLAVGGNWPGSPDATTQFPQWLIVDYIRVYQ